MGSDIPVEVHVVEVFAIFRKYQILGHTELVVPCGGHTVVPNYQGVLSCCKTEQGRFSSSPVSSMPYNGQNEKKSSRNLIKAFGTADTSGVSSDFLAIKVIGNVYSCRIEKSTSIAVPSECQTNWEANCDAPDWGQEGAVVVHTINCLPQERVERLDIFRS